MSYRYQTRVNAVWILIGLTFLVFVATNFNQHLISLLALQRLSLTDRPWTLLTTLFVHSGLWHIFGNMLALYFFGSYLTSLVGDRKFLLVYFGGGILGSILFVLLAPSFSVVVGASGAVFAVGGALAILRPKAPVLIFPIPVPMPLWIGVIGGFVIISFLPFVAWQAHLGGLLFGLVAGYFFKKRRYY